MRVIMLGSGTSSGVPRIGNDWGQCDPEEPRNRRRRVSLLVEQGDTRVLIDTGPELRAQLLDAGVGTVSAVLYTHDHADHTHGIDDLRGLAQNSGAQVECYANEATWAVLRARFRYIFEGGSGYPPIARANLLPEMLVVGGLRIVPFRQIHGTIDTVGYRIADGERVMAYSTDFNAIPVESEAMLEGLDLWVVDALRRRPHPSHPHLTRTLEMIARYSPRRAVLTHMDGSMDYRTLVAELPGGVEPGYDGLVIEL